MHAQRYLGLTVAMLGWFAAACAGGSGSSGFDISPSAERAAIAEALGQSRCVESATLTVCPADEIPGDIPSDLPGGTRIDTGVAGSETLPCLASDATTGCDLTVPFAPQGFPASAEFRIAVRGANDGGQWTISAEPQRDGTTSNPSFDAAVTVGPAPGEPSPPADVQLAVLVFLEPPTTVPATVGLLADSGADFAFVTPQVTLTTPGL